MPEQFEVDLQRLSRTFDSLKKEVRYKSGRFALRKAAQLVRDAARENASRLDDPITAANISKNITERWSSRYYKATGDLMFRVGVMGGAGGRAKSEELASLPGGDTQHWRHLEFGTERTAAQPIMQPALRNNAQAATDVFVTQLDKGIERALKAVTK
ncbi:MAG: HK97-gp10 family putative phage morphogenesis protein [Pseudomonadota bacterium]